MIIAHLNTPQVLISLSVERGNILSVIVDLLGFPTHTDSSKVPGTSRLREKMSDAVGGLKSDGCLFSGTQLHLEY